jgi:hypothetical protein
LSAVLLLGELVLNEVLYYGERKLKGAMEEGEEDSMCDKGDVRKREGKKRKLGAGRNQKERSASWEF